MSDDLARRLYGSPVVLAAAEAIAIVDWEDNATEVDLQPVDESEDTWAAAVPVEPPAEEPKP